MPDKNIANTSLAKMKARLPKAMGPKQRSSSHSWPFCCYALA
jgi:hypothetical protein